MQLSKAGLMLFSQTLAKEFAGKGITVNAVGLVLLNRYAKIGSQKR